jgi:hypothetical protein
MSDSIRPELARRIVWEAQAVRQCFPGRFRLVLTPSGSLAWLGTVPVEDRDFPVRVHYPDDYPASPPLLETLIDLPDGCPHVLHRSAEGTGLCWIAPRQLHAHRRWDPQRHTAATALRAAQRWGLALLVWQALGVWPVPDAWEV